MSNEDEALRYLHRSVKFTYAELGIVLDPEAGVGASC